MRIKLFEKFNSKKKKTFNIEDCPSFGEFSKLLTDLKKLAEEVRKEMPHGTKSDLDDYIENRIFGRDV